MQKRKLFGLFVIVLLISSCSSGQSIIPTETPIPTVTSIPTITPSPTIAPTPIGRSSGKILYTSGKIDDENQTDIFITNIDNSETIQLTNSNEQTYYFYPMASHNGEKIAYCILKDTGTTYYGEPVWKTEIYIMDINGENNQKISSIQMYVGKTQIDNLLIEIQPSWSQDDKKIAFSSNRNSLIDNLNLDDLEIYVINLGTYEIQQLTKAQGYSQHPSWSPDGQYIAFMSDRDGDWDIYYMKSDGTGEDIKITNNTFADRFPSWSNDGKRIIYHSDRDGNLNLYIYNFETGEEIQLTNYPSTEVTARWSPDDSWIVFASDRDGDEEIFIMNLETKEQTQITDNQIDDALQSWIP